MIRLLTDRAARRRLRDRSVHRILRGLISRRQGRSWASAQAFGRGVGHLAWWLSRRDRQRALEHLERAYPGLPAAERQRIARACFLHQGTNLGEILRLMSGSCADVESWVDTEGWEEVEAAQRAGRPVLILTGHCGNWELLAALINCRGLGMRVVARELDSPELQELAMGLRRRFGTETIARGGAGAARQLLAAFREGGALGMLIDQDTRVEGVWVPFFGRPAYTPVGAAKIALRTPRGSRRQGPGTSVAVIPSFIERLADGRHRARFHPPLELPDDPVEATARMTWAIEEQVRRVPEQWVWMHRRWRRQPPPEAV